MNPAATHLAYGPLGTNTRQSLELNLLSSKKRFLYLRQGRVTNDLPILVYFGNTPVGDMVGLTTKVWSHGPSDGETLCLVHGLAHFQHSGTSSQERLETFEGL